MSIKYQSELNLSVGRASTVDVDIYLDRNLPLGPVPNWFPGENRADALAMRDAIAASDAAWLATYDEHQDLFIQLGYPGAGLDGKVAQHRAGNVWVDAWPGPGGRDYTIALEE